MESSQNPVRAPQVFSLVKGGILVYPQVTTGLLLFTEVIFTLLPTVTLGANNIYIEAIAVNIIQRAFRLRPSSLHHAYASYE